MGSGVERRMLEDFTVQFDCITEPMPDNAIAGVAEAFETSPTAFRDRFDLWSGLASARSIDRQGWLFVSISAVGKSAAAHFLLFMTHVWVSRRVVLSDIALGRIRSCRPKERSSFLGMTSSSS